MKLIFLDIDGVLNAHEKLESGYCGIRHDLARRLNRILDAVPDAQLVISSAWRYMTYRGDMTLAGFEYLLLVHGVKCYGRVAGVTDADPVSEPSHFDAEAWRVMGLRWRVEQIKRYLIKNPADAYVVLDDLPLEGIEPFVRTDGAVGMTDADTAKAIGILG